MAELKTGARELAQEATVERFFRSAEARDFDTFRDCFSRTAEIRQNGERIDLDDLVKWTESAIDSVRYGDVRRIVTEDAVVEQHSVEIVLPGGAEFRPPEVCVVFRFDDEARIARVDEYAPLRGIPR